MDTLQQRIRTLARRMTPDARALLARFRDHPVAPDLLSALERRYPTNERISEEAITESLNVLLQKKPRGDAETHGPQRR